MINLSGESRAVMLCVFRACDWTSEDTRTMSLSEQNRVATDHLAAEHADLVRQLAGVLDVRAIHRRADAP